MSGQWFVNSDIVLSVVHWHRLLLIEYFLMSKKVDHSDLSDDSFAWADPRLHFIIVVSCGPQKFSNIEYRPAVKSIWAPLLYGF